MFALKATSWHLHCAEPNLVIVNKTSIQASNPTATFTVAPYIEKIMLRWFESVKELGGGDIGSEPPDKVGLEYPSHSVICSPYLVKLRILPPYFIRKVDAPDTPAYTASSIAESSIDTNQCNSWLSAMHSFIAKAFDSSFAIRIMCYGFLRSRTVSGSLPQEIAHPTGYVVSSILQCLGEVNATCPIINFSLYFRYEWDVGAIWTTCVIQVTEGQNTQQLTDDWRQRDLCFAYLTVILTYSKTG
ncbi:hypothetical protein VNI00_017897 [Paramarasmius palmivorus]|uniref:Uncharacterized protein n=1 Tax=Paramarasmius palmivorus TaxID=297713 RepID=A0AAW0B1B7_9AGAR